MNNEISSVKSKGQTEALNIRSTLSPTSQGGIIINVDHEVDKDEAKVLAMGYKQELKREFSLWSLFGMSFSLLGLLPSVAATFNYQQLVIGMSPLPWIIAIIFITSVALSLAEISSAFPCSAGAPYATSQLAPDRYKPFLSWFAYWTNWFCQITGSPAVSSTCASLMLALYSFNSPTYTPKAGHVFGLSTGIQIVCGIMCSMPLKYVTKFCSFTAWCNVAFLIIVFVMILGGNQRMELNEGVTTKFNPNGVAWSLQNQTDWPQGLAFLISFLGVIWVMSGYDSPFHLAEECSNAAVAVPRAIVMTSVVGGVIGFFFMIAIAYTLVSISKVAEDPLGLGQPFVSFMIQVMKHKLVVASTAFTAISSFFMSLNCLLTSSRVTFAYSRDGLLPGSKIWKTVNPVTHTPIYAVALNIIIGELLLLLKFAGDVAMGAIFSVGAIAAFISFTLPTLLKLTVARNTFKPGPWNLGKLSKPIGWLSVAFVTMMIPILCFPNVKGKHLHPEEMNWTVLVYFGPMLLVTIWYVVDAHKWYTGPRHILDEADIVYDVDVIEDGSEVGDEKKELA
ncbi:GPT1 [Candida metapsilosis]|uniref:GPT1 n=1 Tax=Candida metapsilosis TaxID=273372 RepID=A0A8H8DDW6_9ASCO|nr:GPT1 [Candida metapsilosis]